MTEEESFGKMLADAVNKYGVVRNGKLILDDGVQSQVVGNVKLIDEENEEQKKIDDLRLILNESYDKIIDVLKHYSDIKEDYYSLIAIWIIGTYLYEEFETYPYLFINAMRGSGKTRLLKLIKSMARNGEIVTSLKESVLFRTAKGLTLCIDEFEGINKKENAGLRELLNACYKKGMKVKRMKRVKTATGEEYEVEEFEPYTPICMANIWGMEEVLGDRCISIIIEKSRNERIMRLTEDFDNILQINHIKMALNNVLVQLCSYNHVFTYGNRWNKWVNSKTNYITTLTTLNTQTTLTTLKEYELDEMFSAIWDTGINGRELELMLPLMMIAGFMSKDIFNTIILISKHMTKEKRENEMIESRDVSLVDFISKNSQVSEFIEIKNLTQNFRDYLGEEDHDEMWLNSKWVGKALKRLNLILDKKRVSKGVEVRLDYKKAIEKMKDFGLK